MSSSVQAHSGAVDPRTFQSFAEFYPYYLREHSNGMCRGMHFVGSSLALMCLGMLIATENLWWLMAGLAVGYGFAWIGHFAFEKNRPSTFKRPLYSFMGDCLMYKEMWLGKIPF